MKTFFLKINFIIFFLTLGMMSCEDLEPGSINPDSIGTLAPKNVTATSAIISGSILTLESGTIMESGIFLTRLPDMSVTDPSTISVLNGTKIVGIVEGGKEIVVALTNLKSDTRYSYQAFVTTEAGTIYGNTKILVTSYGTVNDNDGNQYQTVRIGDQVWMRENLKSESYSDQTPIVPKFDQETDGIYGKHYSWNAANRVINNSKSVTSEGACPTGWHVPSDTEWQKLLSYVGVPSDQVNDLDLIGFEQAALLKDAGSVSWADETANNSTGFSILPAGICKSCNHEICCRTAFWTSTPYIFYGFQIESQKIMRGNHPGCNCGLSVRCVKDLD